MKKIFLFCLLLKIGFITLLWASTVRAQVQTEHVVYLKSGIVVRGKIIEHIPNKGIKFRDRDGDVYFYYVSEIEKITREPVRERQRSRQTRTQRGYAENQISFTFAPLIGLGFQDGYRFGFGFRTGATFAEGYYIGATFVYHLGESIDTFFGERDFRVLYFGGELGYDAVLAQEDFTAVIQPYASLGLLNARAGGFGSENYFYVAPGLFSKISISEQVSIGQDIKYLIIPSQTEGNAFILSLTLNFNTFF